MEGVNSMNRPERIIEEIFKNVVDDKQAGEVADDRGISAVKQVIEAAQAVSKEFQLDELLAGVDEAQGVDPRACLIKGILDLDENNHEQKNRQALANLQTAAKGNVPEASYLMALLSYYGYIVEKDQAEAKNWLELAKNQGYEPAREMLERIE